VSTYRIYLGFLFKVSI